MLLDAQQRHEEAQLDAWIARTDRNRLYLLLPSEALLRYLAPLPGKALAVYVLLEWRARLLGRTTVLAPPEFLQQWGCTPTQATGALRRLEATGFIHVVYRGRQPPQVTLLPVHR